MLEALPTRASEPMLTTRGIGMGVLGLVGVFVVSVIGIQLYRVWPVKSPKDPSTLAPIGAVDKESSNTASQATAVSTDSNTASGKQAQPLSSLPMVQTSDNAPQPNRPPLSNFALRRRKTLGSASLLFKTVKKSRCSRIQSTRMMSCLPKTTPHGQAKLLS